MSEVEIRADGSLPDKPATQGVSDTQSQVDAAFRAPYPSGEPEEVRAKLKHPWLVWLARLISTVVTLVWFIDMIVIMLCDLLFGCVVITWEAALHVTMVTLSILSLVFAWKKPFWGGMVMILWGLALSVFAYLTSHPYEFISTLITGIPFIIAGILFVAFGQSNKKTA